MYTTQSFLTNGMISLFNPAHKDALLHDFQASSLDYDAPSFQKFHAVGWNEQNFTHTP